MSRNCNGFEIRDYFWEKNVGDILFTNHLVGKLEISVEVMECYHSA